MNGSMKENQKTGAERERALEVGKWRDGMRQITNGHLPAFIKWRGVSKSRELQKKTLHTR